MQKGDTESGHRYIQRRYDDQNTGFGGCFGKNLVGFRLLPRQRHDICGVEPLIKDREFGALLADKAFDADWLVKDLTERGSKVVIPPRSNRKAPREYDKEMYKWRHLVENFFCKLKEFKKIAMRAEKTDSSFSANIYLAATHRLAIISTDPSLAPEQA